MASFRPCASCLRSLTSSRQPVSLSSIRRITTTQQYVDPSPPPPADAATPPSSTTSPPEPPSGPITAHISLASPNRSQQPASTTPTSQLPYYVGRTGSKQLPIYLLRKRGGNLKQTRLKKITGNLQALKSDLEDFISSLGQAGLEPTNELVGGRKGVNGKEKGLRRGMVEGKGVRTKEPVLKGKGFGREDESKREGAVTVNSVNNHIVIKVR